MLSTGTSAPDFTISLEAGGEFHLSDHRGKRHVVLYFFPKAFTKG